MTRDEAIKILSRIWGGNPQHYLANSYVDAFVALGILKLDEPKVSRLSPDYRAYDALFNFIPSLDYVTFSALIKKAGLKVIEASAVSDDR